MRTLVPAGPASLAITITVTMTLACDSGPPPCNSQPDPTFEEVSLAVSTAMNELARKGMRLDASLWDDARRWNVLMKAIDRELECTSEDYLVETGTASEHALKIKCERADEDDLVTYNPNVGYCGLGARQNNGIACGHRKMVSNCMNAVCWLHDACVGRLNTSWRCYWTRTTDVCDTNFFEDAMTCDHLTRGDMKVLSIASTLKLVREVSLVCAEGENPWTEPPEGCECEAGHACDDNGDCCGPFADYAVVDGVCLPSCGRGLRDTGLSDAGYGCCTETGCAIPVRSVDSWDCGEHCCANSGDNSCNP